MNAEKISTLTAREAGRHYRIGDPEINLAGSKLRSLNGWKEQESQWDYGIGFDVWETGIQAISFEPTQQELESTPSPIKDVLRDLGIKTSDEMIFKICQQRGGHFIVSFLPKKITDERIGIALSSDPSLGNYNIGIVAPVWCDIRRNPAGYDETFPITKLVGFQMYGFELESNARSIWRRYGNLNSTTNDGFRIRRTPEMVNILSSAVDWALKLQNVQSKKNNNKQ